ncbi:MAG: PIN domain-containing protein [Candidatus Coatesbacteria bacterium]
MISRPGATSIERVAADANVILSAVTGRAALRVFTQSGVAVVSTASVLGEVREYLPVMAESYGLAVELLETQLRLLAIKEHPIEDFRRSIPKAIRLIGGRDPDDTHLLALALALGIPVWTNDRDFEGTGVECYTTAKLLKVLGL